MRTEAITVVALLAWTATASGQFRHLPCHPDRRPILHQVEYPGLNEVRLSWPALEGATNYYVRARALGEPDAPGLATFVPEPEITVNSFMDGVVYLWQIQAYCIDGIRTPPSVKDTFGVPKRGFTCGDLFVDTRDGKFYRTIRKGDLCWFRDNANHSLGLGTFGYSEGTGCNAPQKVGAFYSWTAAKTIDPMYTNQYYEMDGEQGVCPQGWHVATDADYLDLFSDTTITIETIQPGGSSGFDLAFGGFMNTNGNFVNVEYGTILVTSSQAAPSRMWAWVVDDRFLHAIERGQIVKGCRGAVRCVRYITDPGPSPPGTPSDL